MREKKMNYSKIYDDLMEKARQRGKLTRGNRERHHVIPCCMGGSCGEVLHLLLREHYLAHALLTKIHPENHGIILAYLMMCNTHKRNLGERVTNSILYAKSRNKMINNITELGLYSGENNGMYGRNHKESKQNMSEIMTKYWENKRRLEKEESIC
jgi:hypothetical protein